MRTFTRLQSVIAAFVLASAWSAFAQQQNLQPLTDSGVVADDDLTLVVGTRFVGPSADGTTAKAQFTDARIPLSAFNETDTCVDERAVEVAKEYFATLGRALGKAGHYYFVPYDQIKDLVSACEKLHGRAPKALVEQKTKIIAFGKVVPTTDAPTLEQSLR